MYSYNQLSWQQSELFHLLKKLEKVSPLPKQEHLPTLLLRSRKAEPLGSLLCVCDTIMPTAQKVPLHLCRLNSCLHLPGGAPVVDTAGGKRCIFYCWAVCEMQPGY